MINGERPGFLSGYKRDYYGGALMVIIGTSAAVQGYSYRIGTLTQMGSGFFPVSLGVILTILGIAIAGFAKRTEVHTGMAEEGATLVESNRPEWRGWFCILASVAAFTLLGQYGGLLIATFAITFISALGDRDNSWLAAVILAAVMTVISFIIFWWALQIQFPLFNWG